MIKETEYSVHVEKLISIGSEDVFHLFKNKFFFELTGADVIQSEFKPGGSFSLTFNNRGLITGKFLSIHKHEIDLEWNVEGFQLPPEVKTIVRFTLLPKEENCILAIHHSHIKDKQAASAKTRAWTDILNNLEKKMQNQ